MKYIDPITKEKKTVYTKASDTLPLGAIVDFDGEEIPAGWEEIIEPEDATVYIGPNEPTDGQDIWIQKGKNLFDIRNIKPTTINGLSMTPDVVNNTLNFTGTPTGYTSFILMENFVPKHDFIVSLNGQMKGTTNMMLEVQMYKDGKYVTSAAADYYIGLDEYDFDYCHIALKRNNNVETNDSAQVLVSYVNNPSYEPYIDKRIYIKNEEGKYDLFVKNRVYIGLNQPEDGEEVWLQKSKNLVNIQAFNYTTVKAHAALLDYYSVPIYLGKPNAVYSVSTTFLNDYTPAGKSIYILVCPHAEDNNGWVPVAHAGQPPVDGGYYNQQVTSDANGYVYFRVSKGTTQVKYEEFLANSLVQIELGATSTSYEPYMTDKKIYIKNDNGIYEEFYDGDDTGWINLPYINSYESYDETSYNPLQYRKIGNHVFLRGMIKGKNANPQGYYSSCTSLPAKIRPKKNSYFRVCQGSNATPDIAITVQSSGQVWVPITEANVWVALDGISYFLD